MKPKLSSLPILLILIIAFAVRLYKIDNPIADWHSWRQADTAAVTRNFIKSSVDLLHPRFDDLSNIPSGKENPQGYRMVEFPIYNLAHYGVFQLQQLINPTCTKKPQGFDSLDNTNPYRTPGVDTSNEYCQSSIVTSGRLTTAIASLLSLLFLYSIIKKLSGTTTAILSSFFFAVLPFNIYYSRVILPDPMMVTCTLGATWFFIKWLETQTEKPQGLHSSAEKPRGLDTLLKFINLNPSPEVKRDTTKPAPDINNPPSNIYFLLSAILASASILLKPTAIFLLLPLIYLAFRKYRLTSLKHPPLYLYSILVLIPFLLWRLWIQQFPEGIPANFWLLNGDGIRFRPAWFRWLFYERLGNLILGGFGLIPFVLGILSKPKKTEGVFYLLSSLFLILYSVVFATGNVRHDYYQIPLVPIVCIFLAKGTIELWTNKKLNRWLSIPISLFLIPASLFLSWYQVRGYYQINHPEIIEAGKTADQLLSQNAKVIAPYQGDTAFLYQTNRPGWPAVTTDIEIMINDLGATHYISVNYDTTTNELIQKHPILHQSEDFIILDLTSPLL